MSAVEESNADQSSQLMIGQFSTLPQKPGRNNLLGHQVTIEICVVYWTLHMYIRIYMHTLIAFFLMKVPTSLSSAEKGQIGELVIGQFLQKPGSIQPHQLQSSERNELVATSSLNLTPCKCTYLLDWWNTIHVVCWCVVFVFYILITSGQNVKLYCMPILLICNVCMDNVLCQS